MKNNKKNKTIIIIIFSILSIILFSSIAYSAFSSTMHITGSASARVEANARITDFRLSSTNNATSSYEEFGKNHIVSNIDLKSSTSSITYYIEITNYGSTDVGILNITGLPNGVNYSIKDYKLHDKICNDSGKCNSFITKTYELTLTSTSSYSGNIKMNFDFRTYHKITYTDIENKGYPTEVIDGGNLSITFKENLKRVHAVSNNNELFFYKQISNNQTITINNITNDVEVKIKEHAARLSYGNLNTVGSEVCIASECFYIISNNGTTITMLAKYNLHVGNRFDDTNGAVALTNPTGKQDETAKGWFSGYFASNPIIGTKPFASTAYWSSTVSSYPSYAYNENSYAYQYLENYKNYLETLEITINDIRLMNLNELEDFGCSQTTRNCSEETKWIYSTTYWSGVAASSDQIWNIASNNGFYSSSYKANNIGIRPVIEIAIDEIFVPVAKLVKGNINTVGSEVCIENECFNIISNDGSKITMLAKYNLYAGYTCATHDSTQCTPYGDEATGLQDETMIGWYHNYDRRDGVIEFSSTHYWDNDSTLKPEYGTSYPTYVYDSNSTVYKYVENYKEYLKNVGTPVKKARLITREELESLGCSLTTNGCYNTEKSWMYTTSYWAGTASKKETLYFIYYNGGYYADISYNVRFVFGVRPVIEIPIKSVKDTVDIIIAGKTYKAEENMTWGEWINSKYNKLGLYSTGPASYFIRNNELQLYTADKSSIKESTIIDRSINYILDTPSESPTGGSN